jgi:acyl-CoA reductase-like NAD-dependent aldehyde dehydrogenase
MVRKEIFGTVVPLAEFHDLDEAIALTNESDY